MARIHCRHTRPVVSGFPELGDGHHRVAAALPVEEFARYVCSPAAKRKQSPAD
uniref:Uncharacterized protein n=1 Tax=Anguilla anguilla TaxID=7936 RepID=A0A0E9PMW9_ANGAN